MEYEGRQDGQSFLPSLQSSRWGNSRAAPAFLSSPADPKPQRHAGNPAVWHSGVNTISDADGRRTSEAASTFPGALGECLRPKHKKD
jgi:hypothetical protein